LRVADDSVMDLGFKLNSKLDPSSHINYVCSKAIKTLRFIMRLFKDCKLGKSNKALFFCFLVRLILDYDAIFGDHCTVG